MARLHSFFFGSSTRVVLLTGCLYIFNLFVFAFFYNHFLTNSIEGFFDALYFSFVTMTTVGYGDIYPDNFWSKLAVLFQVASALIVFGVFVGFMVKEHEDKMLEKKKREEEFKKRKVFSKYSRKLLSVSMSLDRSINSLMEYQEDEKEFFEKIKFSALSNMYQQSNIVKEGFIVNRINSYIYRRNAFLKEIEFLVLNFEVEEVVSFAETVFEHIATSQEKEFIPFFMNLEKMVAGDNHKVIDYALNICGAKAERPDWQPEGNLLNPFIEIYDDVVSQKKMILKIKERYSAV